MPVVGALLLGYCAFVLLDSWIFQKQQGRDLERLLDDDSAASVGVPPTDPVAAPEVPLAARADGLIGRMETPRLGLSAVVVEGIDKRTLRLCATYRAPLCRDNPATYVSPATATHSSGLCKISVWTTSLH